jgi:hypothetical protein
VRDLVAGSGIEFEAQGQRELKGLGEWPVFAVTNRTRQAVEQRFD